MLNLLTVIKVGMEFFGTFIVSASINFSTIYYLNYQEIHWALLFTGIFSAIYITKDISGAHLNPSTTLALLLVRDKQNIININKPKEQKMYILYFMSQIAGAFFSCFLSAFFNKNNIFKFSFCSNIRASNVFLSEILCGFLYNYTYLCLSNHKSNIENKQANLSNETLTQPFAMTISFCFIASISLNISGSFFNPALAIAHCISRFLITNDSTDLKYILVYALTPFAGSVCAVKVYRQFFSFYYESKAKCPFK